MKFNAKKFLLTGTALVAAASFSAQAQAAVTTVNTTGNFVVSADPAASPAINYTADGTATVNDAVDVTGTVTTATTGTGTLTLLGTTTVSGAVGTNGNRLKAVNTTGAAGKTATFGDDVFAVTVTTGAGATDFGGVVTGTTLTTGAGAVTAADLVTETTLNVGSGGVTLNGAGANAIGTVAFGTSGGTVTLGDGANETGNFTTGTAGTGTLTLAGSSAITGAIGASGHALGVLNTGVTGKTVTVSSDVFANTINITGTGATTTTGTTNGNVVYGAAGSYTATGATTGNVSFGANDGSFTQGSGTNLTGTVDATTAGKGTLTLAGGAQTVSGNVGATQALKVVSAGANGAVSTFSGTVKAATITVAGTGEIDFNNTVTATTALNYAGDGVVKVASGKSLTAPVTTASNNTGTLTLLGGTQTVTGAVGGANKLKAVNAGQAGGATTFTSTVDSTNVNVGTGSATFNGNVTATNIALTTGTINYNGATNAGTNTFSDNGTINVAAGKTVGAVDSSSAGKGNLNFAGSGTVGAIGATQVLNTLTLNGTGTTVNTGAAKIANTTELNGNILNVTGTVTTATGQTIGTTITSATNIGHIVSSGNATVVAGTKVAINVTTNSIADAHAFTVVDGNDGGAAVATLTAGNVTDNSYIYSFTQDTTNTHDLVLVAHRAALDSATVASNSNNAAAGAVLENTTSSDASFQAVQNSIASASTRDEVNERIEATQASVDGSNIAGAMNATSEVFGVTQMRLAALEDSKSGMAAGDMMTGSHTWGQVFGQHANQDVRDGIDGYDSNTYGVAVGGDVDAFSGRGHIGAALSYARTNANSDNANSTDTDIDSYQATLYGDMGLQNDMYLKGMVAYAFNDNNTTRHDVGGVAGLTANGDYNANQFAVRAELGRPFPMQQGFVLTPSLLADYMYYNAESYTETGAGGANLNVDQDSLSKFDLGVGLAASMRLQDNSGGTWKPGVSASYKYDLVGDNIQDTSSFTGGGASFDTKGADPARSQFAVGANVKYMTVNNWDFSAEYNYEFKSDYGAHDGILRAGYKF